MLQKLNIPVVDLENTMHVVNLRFVICYPVVILFREIFSSCPVKECHTVFVLVDYECSTKQTFPYSFDHGLSRDVDGFHAGGFLCGKIKKKSLVYLTRRSS